MAAPSGLTGLGKALYWSRAARFYRDGSGAGFVWRWWHPISWLLAPLGFVASGLLTGFPEAWRYRSDLGFGMKPWFKANPDRLEWIP